MNIAVTGSSGFLGSALVGRLTREGHRVLRLVRREPRDHAAEARWDPLGGGVAAGDMDAVEAVVHLAGDNIARSRWTDSTKRRIRESRVEATRGLCSSIAGMREPPRVLLSASAVGFYGDRGEEVLTERSTAGTGFLADLCRAWEDACDLPESAGVRVVKLRIGVVLDPSGAALGKMLRPFKLGLGGRLGNGRQHMSWITRDDFVDCVLHALDCAELEGPVNTVSPNPVTNREFTRALGKALGRPTLFPLPAFAARLLFGEMADATFLASAKVIPERLEQTGFSFSHPEIGDALKALLNR